MRGLASQRYWLVGLGALILCASPRALAQKSAPPASAPAAPIVAAPAAAPPTAPLPAASPTHGELLRAYHEALARRRLGSQEQLTGDDVHDRLA